MSDRLRLKPSESNAPEDWPALVAHDVIPLGIRGNGSETVGVFDPADLARHGCATIGELAERLPPPGGAALRRATADVAKMLAEHDRNESRAAQRRQREADFYAQHPDLE